MSNYHQLNAPMAIAVPVPQNPYPSSSKVSGFAESNSSSSFASIVGRQRENLSETQIQALMAQGFTRGLAASTEAMLDIFAFRFWIVDNSGSMNTHDGNRIVALSGSDRKVKMVPCTRWEEISECVKYHIRLAGLLQAPTQFRLLNPSIGRSQGLHTFTIATNEAANTWEVENAIESLSRARPGGFTPLTNHVVEIASELEQMAPILRQTGKKAVIVIATDGLPTDSSGYSNDSSRREFVQALRMLEQYPVWVVIRLCTDDDKVVDFYNDLDKQLEMSLEILDDFPSEAKEVIDMNPWVNYALPLHRLREFGFYDRVFDLLDERPLTKSETRDYLQMLFGSEHFDGIPDPSLDWKAFSFHIKSLQQAMGENSMQYDPVERKMKPWISLKKLDRAHRPRGFLW